MKDGMGKKKTVGKDKKMTMSAVWKNDILKSLEKSTIWKYNSLKRHKLKGCQIEKETVLKKTIQKGDSLKRWQSDVF